ncbi:hypothetical protein HII28_19800 [Planctomonas sp. JC2975]|uniref:hypothetical protein n=1 Tax=Planctomonas sp. JC2975 TaxID=2729626 RepID=UPI001475B918|nr:hypothetical protein [Planctomonas sp. JC2975]NNC14101.1 hypothetical protein [Planctomonas sp. JC2975]
MTRTIARMCPGSVVLQVNVSPRVLDDIASLATLDPEGLRARLNFRMFLFLAVESDIVNVYGGIFRSRLIVQVATADLTSVVIAKSMQGMYNLEGLRFEFHHSGHEYVLNAPLQYFAYALPHISKGTSLRRHLAAVTAVVGTAGQEVNPGQPPASNSPESDNPCP